MKEIALITGASSGIGYEIAKLFAADKTDLLIVARNEKMLLEIKNEFEEQFKIDVFTVNKIHYLSRQFFPCHLA